jgi:phytoene synthase
MAGIYGRLLDRIERDPAAVLRGRVSVPTGEKLVVAAGQLFAARERPLQRPIPRTTRGVRS